MFASKITKEITVGSDPVRIRKLSAAQLEKALEVRQLSVAAMTRGMGPEILRAFRDDLPETKAAHVTERRETRKYDRRIVLREGIMSLPGFDAPGARGFLDAVDDLEEWAAEQIYGEIVDLSDPPAAIAETARKNDSGPSIDS